jgi:hypothetical protein
MEAVIGDDGIVYTPGKLADVVDIPYAKRRFVVVVEDDFSQATKNKAETKNIEAVKDVCETLGLLLARASERLRDTSIGTARGLDARGAIGGGAALLLASGVVAALVMKFKSAGLDVLPVPLSRSACLNFPPGHPMIGVLYVAHPAIFGKYYPAAEFHRLTFEHKFAEAVNLLMALGATNLKVEHIAGWSTEFSASMNVGLRPFIAEVDPRFQNKKQSESAILFSASLDGTPSPCLPENLVWYHHEPNWQNIANGRLKYGMRDFSLTVRYEEDYGVNAALKGSAKKAGIKLGGEFKNYKPTVWRIVGEFRT